MKNKTDEEKNIFYKEQGKEIINSIKEDFQARFVISDNTTFNKLLLTNDGLLESYMEVVPWGEKDGIMAFQLK